MVEANDMAQSEDFDEEEVSNGNPHCSDYDSEGRCNQCGQFDCYECDWGYPFDGCKCRRCENYREAEEESEVEKVKPVDLILSLDEDLEQMDHKNLKCEIKKLRAGIRKHRDSAGHDLCWHVPELWNLLPEKVEPQPAVPATKEFLHQCKLYRKSLDKKT